MPGPIIAPEPWELFVRLAYSKAAAHLLLEHPTLDAFIERLGAEPSDEERVRIMREELGPWLLGVCAGGQHRGHALHCRGRAEGGGMAVDPRPHGITQLGVCDPRAITSVWVR